MSVVTPRFLENQVARLLRRAPALAELRWHTHTIANAPLDEVGTLMHSAWQRAYGNRIRIAFSPELLQYAAACSADPGMITLVEDRNGVCGAVVGLPTDWDLGAPHGPVTLSTGLCVATRREGSSLVELLLSKHTLNLMEAGHAFSFHWRATSSPEAETSGKGLMHVRCIPLYAKPLNCATAARLGNLSWWRGLGLRWIAQRHRSGLPLPLGLSMDLFTERHADECAAFLMAHQPQNGIRRRFTPALLARRCLFDKGSIRAQGFVFHEAQQVVGMAWGYVNPVSGGEAYWAMDGAVFHSELPAPRRTACLSAVEGYARDTLECFAIMTPGSVCREPLDQLGYFVVRRYHVGAVAYKEVPELTRENVGGVFLELR